MQLGQRLNRLAASASRPVDGASAAAFRGIFGILSFVAIVRFFVNGWIESLFVNPSFHFKYLGFEWVQPWSELGLNIHFAVLALLAPFIAVGLFYRISAVLFFIGFVYVVLLDSIAYLNYHYWLGLASFLIIFMPLNRTWSIDAKVNPTLRQSTVPSWVIWIIRAQLGIVYFYGGVAKLNPDWLFDALPLSMWMHQYGNVPLFGPILQHQWLAYSMSWAGTLFDLTIVGWLVWRRSRLIAYAVLIGFHLTTWALFPYLGLFPWLMIGSMLIFFDADWPRKVGILVVKRSKPPKRIASDFRRVKTSVVTSERRNVWLRRVAVIAVLVFLSFQIVIPLRHWVYPGNVRWNDEVYRFSWRMMLSEKAGSVTYRVLDIDTGSSWSVEPLEYLTPLQVERMSACPDMIHELALVVAEDFRSRGYLDVNVYADAFVSLNGRPDTRIIDPEVDLATVKRSFFGKEWILRVPTDDIPKFNPVSPAVSINAESLPRNSASVEHN